jgi:geranylgeranyl reductase family protein
MQIGAWMGAQAAGRRTSGLYDVAVVGGGPAGAAAALALAQGGARVVVLEALSVPRYKTCGGGLVRRALRQLPAEVQPALQRSLCAAELHVHDLGMRFVVQRAEPLVAMAMRADLDAALLAAARRQGVEVRSPCRVVGVLPGADGLQVATTDGTVQARWVVAADGVRSRVAAALRWSETPSIPALEAEIPVEPADLERFAAAARFDFGRVPHGYAWVFPKAAHLSIGVLSTRRGGTQRLHQHLDRYRADLDLRPAGPESRHGALIPVGPRPGGCVRGRVLLAGDAAGLADPVTCEGISWALRSGRLAAAALLDGGFVPAEVGRRYARGLAAEILPELRWGRRLAAILYGHPRLRRWLFRRHGPALAEAMASVIAGDATYSELLGDPRRYFRLLARSRQRRPAGRVLPSERP